LFPSHDDATKYLLLLTDAMPTIGDDPSKATLDAVEKAVAADITVSLIGIQLDKKAEDFAQKIVDLGKGRLYIVKNLEEMDRIVLLDYYSRK
jgi:Mg-chelatase subunit ChlD